MFSRRTVAGPIPEGVNVTNAPDNRSTCVRFAFNDELVEIGLEEPVDRERLYALQSMLSSYGFAPDHELRAATQQEIDKLAGLPGAQDMVKRRGVAVYTSPLRIRRAADRAGGRAFDALRTSLEACHDDISDQKLAEIVRHARLNNLPPGETGRDYC